MLPGTSGVPELVDRVRGGVGPGLATLTFREIISGTSDSEVDEEVEFSVEGSGVRLTNPRVVKGRRVVGSLPEALLGEVNLENLV